MMRCIKKKRPEQRSARIPQDQNVPYRTAIRILDWLGSSRIVTCRRLRYILVLSNLEATPVMTDAKTTHHEDYILGLDCSFNHKYLCLASQQLVSCELNYR